MVQHIVTGESTSDGEVYLVTGSHGHIGSYIVEELCRQKDNIEIVCLDNFYNANIDNLKIYFHKNGTYFNSGDPANGTGNVTTLVSGTDYSPITGALNTNSNSVRNNDWQFNFGSPPYSVSSGNSDAEGFGNFEYAVPSGFFSLCSKNLAEYG